MEEEKLMADLMSNIYLNEEDYRIAPDLSVHPSDYKKDLKDRYVHWNVYTVPLNLRIAGFPSQERAEAFVAKRCNPNEERPKIYSDICRCGRSGPAWDYIRTGELVFERCANCRMPMRHDVMLALNSPLTKDFDLDNFLEMF